jgi:mRNA-degrading endonuclease RelE of RelBE toxin-antitoxin system
MPFTVILSPEVIKELDRLRAVDRSAIIQAIEHHLIQAPERKSKSRIKRLKEMRQPQYRLRVDDFRVYYDVDDARAEVHVLGVVTKKNSGKWLEEKRTQL